MCPSSRLYSLRLSRLARPPKLKRSVARGFSMKKPIPPRTTKVVKVQFSDKSILDAELVCYPRYRSFWRAGACCIELRLDGVGRFSNKSNDYFGALTHIRREL